MKKVLIFITALLPLIGILSSCEKNIIKSLSKNSDSKTLQATALQQVVASQFPLPQGNLNGWQQVTAEDFLTPATSAQFTTTYQNSWFPYDDGGKYYRSAVSADNGLMNITLNGLTGAAGVFGPPSNRMGHMYGKYSICFKAVGADRNGTAIMVWPSSNVWGDGEVDYPEGNFDATLQVFQHGVGCTQCYAADGFNTGITWRDWHVASTEWTPSGVKYFLDGGLIKTVTHDIPINNHRFTIQMAPNDSNALTGNFYIDWVGMYAMCSTCTPAVVGTTQDNTNAAFAYTYGTWVTANNSNHYSGSEKETNTLYGTIEYTFNGTRAEMYSYLGQWSGKCDVYLDNVWKTTVDQYTTGDSFQQLIYNTGTLPAGSHQVRLVNIGKNNPASAGVNIGIDKAIFYK